MARSAARDAEGARRSALSSVGEPEEDSEDTFTVATTAVGSAIPGETASLQAQEVNPGELRAGELTKQVVELIDTDAEGVAKLILRWADSKES